ncbi:MAG TPA: DUF1592 domain-containing protein, partial [Polyangiaceae bacterium]|nr:DUF1592 domain-containing protein [Polyangiaceae bacterium]
IGSGGSSPAVERCTIDAGPSDVRGLTNLEYDNTVRDLMSYPGSASKDFGFLPDELLGRFEHNVGTAVGVDRLAQYIDAAAKLAERAATSGSMPVPCLDTAEEPCVRSFIVMFGKGAFRRPLTASESTALRSIYDEARRTGTAREALGHVIQATLGAPQFYLLEPKRDFSGLVALSPYELATRISYFVVRSTPDEELLNAAESGKLSDSAGVEAEVRRLLFSSRGRQGVADFFRQWLSLDALDTMTKNVPEFAGLHDYMKTETQLFAEGIFFEGSSFQGLLTSPRTFVNEPLAKIYEMPGFTGTSFRAAVSDPTVRGGLLTHASLLSMHSFDESSPTRRGRFVREQLLCSELPPPPANVNTSLPPGIGELKTNRQRYEASTGGNASCNSCHLLMDPIGFTFEHYDALGRYRAADHGHPIDATGAVHGAGADLEGTVDGPIDLSHRLAASRAAQTCFAKQWFRFAMARDPSAQDTCSLDRAVATIREGAPISDLIVGIALSDSFRYARR